MDPFTGAILAGVLAWLIVSPDRRTLAATRGSAGAVRSAGRASGGVVADRWRSGAPVRAQRQARWAQTVRDPDRHPAVRTAAGTGLVMGKTARTTAATGRAVKAGVKAVPPGYRKAAGTAVKKRELAQTKSRRKQPSARPVAQKDRCQWVAGTDPCGKPRLKGYRYCLPHCEEAYPRAFGGEQPSSPNGKCPPESPAGRSQPKAQKSTAQGGGSTEPTTGGPTVEIAPIKVTELLTTGDLRSEVEAAQDAADRLHEALEDLAKWAGTLGDRYVAAPFGTSGMSKAVAGVGDATPDPKVAVAFSEACSGLLKAIEDADTLKEQVGQLGAEGKVEAFADQ